MQRIFLAVILVGGMTSAIRAQEQAVSAPDAKGNVVPSELMIFPSGEARIHWSYVKGELAYVKVEFSFLASETEYQRVVAMIDGIGPLGVLRSPEGFRVSDMSDRSIRTYDYQNADLTRESVNCAENPDEDCGIRSIAVAYWFPAEGIVNEITLASPKRFGTSWYDLRINDRTFRVIDTVADSLTVGQFVHYSTNADGLAIRLDP